MFNLLINFLIICIFVLLKKKLLIDSICVSPIPSKSTKLINNCFLFFKLNNFIKLFIEPKKPARIFAFS